jgi:hypothetical protein
MPFIYSGNFAPLERLRADDHVDALEKESAMLDVVFLAGGTALVVVTAWYARVCDWL